MDNPSFHLEGIVREKDELEDFEGPLSLILMLLSKNKIEIRDIKISDILDQYLAYLDQMQSMDLEIASEFIQMASHLLYIKTKMLLSSDEEEMTELEALMETLEQLKARDALTAVQKLTPALRDAAVHGQLYFSKLPEPPRKAAKEYNYRHEPVDLLRVLFSVYSRGGKTPVPDSFSMLIPQRIVFSVREKSRQILSLLRGGSFTLNELYKNCSTRSELVAAFVSVLELCSMGGIAIERRGNDYKLEFKGGDVDNMIEKIVEQYV